MRKLFLLLAALLLVVSAAAQTAPQPCSSVKADEKKAARPSPPGCTDAKFSDGKMVSIQYSRPNINDPKTHQPRVVWGTLVPWGQEWRMGANEATTFVTDTDLDVGGTKVPAGSYTLDLLPQQNGPWKLIINKTTGNWGIPYPGAASDLARIDVKTSKLPTTVQQFTLTLDPPKGNATKLNIDWENTRATVDIKEAK
jgi:uncharacterized protein (DUF2141 family)